MGVTDLQTDPFRLLGEALRLRILRLLAREWLSAGELVDVLGRFFGSFLCRRRYPDCDHNEDQHDEAEQLSF